LGWFHQFHFFNQKTQPKTPFGGWYPSNKRDTHIGGLFFVSCTEFETKRSSL